MNTLLYRIIQNIVRLYRGYNILWQVIFVMFTYIFVTTGFDWSYYLATRGVLLQSILFPAVIVGFFLPLIAPICMYIYAKATKNARLLNATYGISQAGILGFAISSFYKVFTGRVGPPHILTTIDSSTLFRFGFYRGGAFQGWPSSHTSVAFAMSMALVMLYPENKVVRYLAIIYAIYIGIGISVNIHWFSDFAGGVILGTVIGLTVGRAFYQKYKASLVA